MATAETRNFGQIPLPERGISGGAVGKMADMEFQRDIAEPATARTSPDESQWRCRREEWWTRQLLRHELSRDATRLRISGQRGVDLSYH